MDNTSFVKTTAFIIGDPHFKYNTMLEGKDFAEKSIKAARDSNPSFIVILGDTLDTHEIVRIDPHFLATEWISELSTIAHVYLLIGNHDLINASQYLSSKHIFTPLKKWPNITVVDKPVFVEFNEYSFVFCPYVEPGRFIEALDTLIDQGETWEMVDCIFGHQEFKGCKMGAIISEKGDVWDENYPPVITGHIHDSQIIKNVYMPGSAYQHNFGDSPNKKLWFVTFGQNEDSGFSIKKIDIGMKKKKIYRIDIEEIEDFDISILDKYQIKLYLRGNSEQFKIFRSSKKYQILLKTGIKFSYDRISINLEKEITDCKRSKLEEVSFLSTLKKVISTKNSDVKEVYEEIFGVIKKENTPCNLVFEDDCSYHSSSEEKINFIKDGNKVSLEEEEEDIFTESYISSYEEISDEDL
jgi:DNA repair exonuclease SbcCD nuclease subunit